MNLNGTILKGVGGFYYVRDEQGRLHECRACGRFRKENIVPLPGDNVRFSIDESKSGYIEEIFERGSELLRPRVANIDQIAVVLSVYKPKPDCLLCDKLILQSRLSGIAPLLVLNKCDAGDTAQIQALQREYKNVCPVVCVSAVSGEGLSTLKQHLKGRRTCFAGQSAVGKSSLLNALFPGLTLETGGLSKKTDRGRHTTRHAELLVLDDISGMVADTPGFSFLESGNLKPQELCRYYTDMEPFLDGCRFASCLHADEPDCAVKQAVSDGHISEGRYQRYLTILKELEEKRSKEYG